MAINCGNSNIYTEPMFERNFYPLINKSTRITSKSLVAIDLIRTNATGFKVKSFILAHEENDL